MSHSNSGTFTMMVMHEQEEPDHANHDKADENQNDLLNMHDEGDDD